MKSSTLLLLAGGGILVLASRKPSVNVAAQNAALTAHAAVQAANKASGPAAAKETIKRETEALEELLIDHSIKGMTVGAITTPSAPLNYAPFSPQRPPNVNQLAILIGLVGPVKAKTTVTPELWKSALRVIGQEPKLLSLVSESSGMNKIFNAVLLLSPQRQRMFAAKCAFMATEFLDVGDLGKTPAKKIALEIVSTVRSRADGAITAEKMAELNNPRIEKLRKISKLEGHPGYFTSVIESLEYASGTATSKLGNDKKKIIHYLDMVSSVSLSKKSINEFERKVAEAVKESKSPGANIRIKPGMTADEARAAEAKLLRKGERNVESDFLKKLLREL